MSLRARIFLLIALAVAPAFALLIFDHQQDLRLRENEAEQRALHSTFLVSGELDQLLKGIEATMRAAGQTPALAAFRNPECSEYLKRLANLNPGAGLMSAVDNRGSGRCGGGIGVDIADREYFRAALESDELVVGTYTIGRVSGEAILPLALRYATEDGWGVIVAGVRVAWLRDHFVKRFEQFPPHSSLTLVDRNGIMIVRLPNADREGHELVNYRAVVDAPAPGTFRSVAERNADGIARFLGFTPLASPPRGVAIAVGLPQDLLLQEVRANAMRSYLLFGLVVLVATLAALLGGRLFIQRPANALLDAIERWRNQDTSARVVPESEKSEFGRLGMEFNRMADELEAALKYKDVLLRELSHRVMNSLTTISSLMRLQARSSLHPDAVRVLEQAVTRVDGIALAYRRMQAARGVETIEFAPFLEELCRDISASMMSSAEACTVRADPLSLPPEKAISLSLVANEFLTNAIKHGTPDAPIAVSLDCSADRCRLAVRSRGALPAGYDVNQGRGFGTKMVALIAAQLDGTFSVREDAGEVEFAVSFAPERRPGVPAG